MSITGSTPTHEPFRESRRAGQRILIVDDDPTSLQLVKSYLTRDGYEVITAGGAVEALRILHRQSPPIVVTDWTMPKMNGIDLCRTIRSSEAIGFVYVIVMTAQAETERLVEAFQAGADDFVSKPVNRHELTARLTAAARIVGLEADLARQQRAVHKANAEMAVLNEKLHRMAATDELTGLPNRREAMRRIEEHWAIACRRGEPMACIMLDIDRFKRCNDEHGHEAGDVVLQETARVLGRFARAGESVCRFGGEEFLVICPRATAEMAATAAERFRQAVASHAIPYQDRKLSMTISAGLAEREPAMTVPMDLLRAADEALYAAKRGGRNRVCVSGENPSVATPTNRAVASAPAVE
jgi:diguanylate cyclase (GGDEF)-like protein